MADARQVAATEERPVVLKVTDLTKHFRIRRLLGRNQGAVVRAVDGVSFSIRRGETVALVGESGCGKSTTARMLAGLEVPTSGKIEIDGHELYGPNARRKNAATRVQMVFQDPFGALNPRMAVSEIIAEPLILGTKMKRADRQRRVTELMDLVGLSESMRDRYPHEFSGGQRQRIVIARALSVDPEIVICDEPVSALDVSIQAQIINLMQDLQQELGLTYLFISHDLSVVRQISNQVAVMYLGKIVEMSTADEIFNAPKHPYTQALLAAVPRVNVRLEREPVKVIGEIPSPINLPTGCRFHPRCARRTDICVSEPPAESQVDQSIVCCHHPVEAPGR